MGCRVKEFLRSVFGEAQVKYGALKAKIDGCRCDGAGGQGVYEKISPTQRPSRGDKILELIDIRIHTG